MKVPYVGMKAAMAPKAALTLSDDMSVLRLPRRSARPPQTKPPIIIPKKVMAPVPHDQIEIDTNVLRTDIGLTVWNARKQGRSEGDHRGSSRLSRGPNKSSKSLVEGGGEGLS